MLHHKRPSRRSQLRKISFWLLEVYCKSLAGIILCLLVLGLWGHVDKVAILLHLITPPLIRIAAVILLSFVATSVAESF